MAGRIENLTPFPPGTSGNPAGSSRKARLTARLLAMLDEKNIDEAFLKVGLAAALKGDFKFWQYLYDRIDGPARAEESESATSLEAVALEMLTEDERIDRAKTSNAPAEVQERPEPVQ